MSVPTEPNVNKQSKVNVEDNREKVYVWQLPVRIFHILNALAIVILAITGILIANPPASGTAIHADAFTMGAIHNLHVFAAIIFTLNLIVRFYWVFKGNKYAKSNPLRKAFWVDVWKMLKFYLFIDKDHDEHVGHNALAELSYWIFIGIGSLIMIFTGFYLLFEPSSHTFLGQLFAWVPKVFGGDSFEVRSWHHIVMWFFIIFVVIHVYMSARDSIMGKNKTLTSIFTGYKRIRKDSKGEKK